jgi:hypothetical protein
MHSTPVRLIRGLSAIVLATLAAASCDLPLGSDKTVYTLHTVDGAALPGIYRGEGFPNPSVQITAGTLRLDSDGTFTEVYTLACKTPPPAGAPPCNLGANAPQTAVRSFSGRWSDKDALLTYYVEGQPGGAFGADFGGDVVLVLKGGTPNEHVWEYRRR